MKDKAKFDFHTFRSGLLMGMADAVPGVSGGTIALILGIYNKLIFSLFDFLNFFKNKFPTKAYNQFFISFQFLLTLGLGMLLSYYIVTKALVGSEDNKGLLLQSSSAPFIFSLFSGLVLSSIREPWKLVFDRSLSKYILCLIGIFIVVIYTNFSLESNGNDKMILVISGGLALTAMLLPGISGALVLFTLGQYTVVASSLHNYDFQVLFYFLSGGLIALFSFVPIMNFFLLNYKEEVMSVLTGLMIGSLVTLWPWKESYDSEGISPNLGLSQIFEDFTIFSIIGTICFSFLGFVMYLGLTNLEKESD